MSYDHYRKNVSHLDTIDVYRVLDLWGVTNPAVQHAIKKLLNAGQRGAKTYERDLREAHDSIARALQMIAEDCNKEPVQRGWPYQSDSIWIEWKGGRRPVSGDTRVEVRLFNGESMLGRADVFTWHWVPITPSLHPIPNRNIAAYRVTAC